MKENLKSEIEKYEIMRLSSIKSKTYVKNQMKNSQKYFMPSTKFIFFPVYVENASNQQTRI